jgi:hypothetical protein
MGLNQSSSCSPGLLYTTREVVIFSQSRHATLQEVWAHVILRAVGVRMRDEEGH